MLSDLPPEIVSEIASHLPYSDILVLRQAFAHHDFRDAINAHVVWLNLAKQYLRKNPHSHCSNTKPLSSLTTDQLRERFERRLVVDHVWQLPARVYPTIKRLRRLSSVMIAIKIAPGGRWLFSGTQQCSLYYWDLDSVNPEPVLLAPCNGVGNTPGESNTITEIDFLVEHGDPLSRFTVACIGRDFHREYSELGEWLFIWDVIPQDNGVLKAERLRTLPLPYHGSISDFSFNHYLAARTMAKRLDVYWWRDCTDTRLVRCTLVFETDPIIAKLYCIGSDKLLVFTGHQLHHEARLYALEPEYSEVDDIEKVVSYATMIWSFRFSSANHGYDISRLYFDGVNYTQIIAMHDGIFNLTIPASQTDKATVVKVSDFDLPQRQCDADLYGLGFNKGYCRVGKELYRFGYSPTATGGPYKSGVTFDSRLGYAFRGIDSFFTFDEELGRMVSKSQSHIILHDFSLPLYNYADVCLD